MNFLIADAEIEKAIPNKNDSPIPGIKYCQGWNDHANMGISVMGAYEHQLKRYRVFMEDNKEEFISACEQADVVVTFNGIGFDAKLVKAVWGYDIPEVKHYDILREVRIALDLDPVTGDYVKGLSLDAITQKNLGICKTGNGALAPIDWQQGRIGKVIDYCLNDILMTLKLFERIINIGELVCPNTGKILKMRIPE